MPRGASLIELLVAAAVVTTLAGIAGVVYQNAREKTLDNITEASLQAAAAAQNRHQQTRGRYAVEEQDIDSLPSGEFTITTGPSAGPKDISVTLAADGTLILAGRSQSGNCLVLRLSGGGREPALENAGRVLCQASRYL